MTELAIKCPLVFLQVKVTSLVSVLLFLLNNLKILIFLVQHFYNMLPGLRKQGMWAHKIYLIFQTFITYNFIML